MNLIHLNRVRNHLRSAFRHSALAVAVALVASSGVARATNIYNFWGGIADVSGYYTGPDNRGYTAGSEGFAPHVNGSWSGWLDVDYGPQLYFYNSTRFTLTADPGFTVTLLNFQYDQSSNGHSGFTVLDHSGNTLATVSGVQRGWMTDFAWPTLKDSQLTIVFATDDPDNSSINNIKFSQQATALTVTLTSPATTQGYPTGTSITATATVEDPGSFTDTVTFHTSRVDPAGDPTVETVSTDTSSPFSADLGILPAGTYEINATVANNASPPGTAISATRTFTVADAIPTTTTLTTTANPSTYGQLTATASVLPVPTGGTVQFYDGGYSLGSPVAVNTSTGMASLSLNTLGAGTHKITADYSGHWLHEASVASALSQGIDKAPLTVRALNTLRAPNAAIPNPFPHQITGYQNGQSLANSGVTGTPDLTTDAILSSPAGNYEITCAVGTLAAVNYSFTLVKGTLTVADVANTFSVNFYAYGGLSTDEQKATVLMPTGVPAGFGDWYTSGWTNFKVPWAPTAPLAPVTLISNKASTATFTFKDCRNGWPYLWDTPRTTLLGDGNGNMMDGHVNSTLDPGDPPNPNLFEMEVTGIPFAVYDVIFYMGANQAQFGDGTGVIVFNGGPQRAFTLKPGAFDGTFTEMIDATTQGNYIVFKGVTGASFTAKTCGTGPDGFNHLGPAGFQIREATGGYSAWAALHAGGATAPADGDYNNDGVKNGVAFFMGMNGLAIHPGVVGNSVTWPYLNGVTSYKVQTSSNLSPLGWIDVLPGDPRLHVTAPGPSGSVRYDLLPPTGGRLFVRLLVTP